MEGKYTKIGSIAAVFSVFISILGLYLTFFSEKNLTDFFSKNNSHKNSEKIISREEAIKSNTRRSKSEIFFFEKNVHLAKHKICSDSSIISCFGITEVECSFYGEKYVNYCLKEMINNPFRGKISGNKAIEIGMALCLAENFPGHERQAITPWESLGVKKTNEVSGMTEYTIDNISANQLCIALHYKTSTAD
ncbi:MAG: hypothetical protein R3F02_15775 [Thiolinea sp.]